MWKHGCGLTRIGSLIVIRMDRNFLLRKEIDLQATSDEFGSFKSCHQSAFTLWPNTLTSISALHFCDLEGRDLMRVLK